MAFELLELSGMNLPDSSFAYIFPTKRKNASFIETGWSKSVCVVVLFMSLQLCPWSQTRKHTMLVFFLAGYREC